MTAQPPPYGWAPPPDGWGPPHAPKPGVIPLRPLGVGELLDGAFTTIRRYPAATIGLAFAVMLVVAVIRFAVMYSLLHGVHSSSTASFGSTVNHEHPRLSLANGIATIVSGFAGVLLSGLLTVVVGQAVLGRPLTIGEAWSSARSSLLRLLGATLSVAAIVLLVVIAAAVPGIAILVAGAVASGLGTALLGIVLIAVGAAVAAVWATIVLAFTTPALVLEHTTIGTALRRSRHLVRTSWWRIFGILVLAGIISSVFAAVVQAPFSIAASAGAVFSSHVTDPGGVRYLVLTGIGRLISGTLVTPFTASMVALLYIDRRMRVESLDATLRHAASSGTSPA